MTEIEVVATKVSRYLSEIFPAAKKLSDFKFSVSFESTNIWIRIEKGSIPKSEKTKNFHLKHDIPHVVVRVWATILIDVPRSPGLFKWVATEGQEWILGGTRVVLGDDGDCSLIFSYSLAGETLDPGEFKNAVLSVGVTADHLDDIAQAKFGGMRFVDYKEKNKNDAS